jgi:hypothetical protein
MINHYNKKAYRFSCRLPAEVYLGFRNSKVHTENLYSPVPEPRQVEVSSLALGCGAVPSSGIPGEESI